MIMERELGLREAARFEQRHRDAMMYQPPPTPLAQQQQQQQQQQSLNRNASIHYDNVNLSQELRNLANDMSNSTAAALVNAVGGMSGVSSLGSTLGASSTTPPPPGGGSGAASYLLSPNHSPTRKQIEEGSDTERMSIFNILQQQGNNE